MNQKTHVARNFNYLMKTEEHLKVTYTVEVVISHNQCNTETLLLDINKKWYTTYRTVVIPMTLSDL